MSGAKQSPVDYHLRSNMLDELLRKELADRLQETAREAAATCDDGGIKMHLTCHTLNFRRETRELFDVVRVDHFRGFEAAWQVSAKAKTACNGNWIKGPGEKFFDAVLAALGQLPIIAEDLGVITPEVLALRDRYNFPGMKILQFAFDSKLEDHDLPHKHVKHGVVYTGTHDNDTTKGWSTSRSEAERHEMNAYLGTSGDDCVGDLMRAAMMSVADTAIIPFQDILKLGSEARMNIPGTPYGDWEWRFLWGMLPQDLAASVRSQLERYGRAQNGE